MRFHIKLPHRLRYAVILVLLCVVIIGLSLFVLKTDVHPPFDSTRENLALFLSKGMDPYKVDIGEVSPAFEEIRVWLEERRQSEGFFRTLWLPSDRVLINKILVRYDPPTLKGKDELDHMMLVLLPLLRGGTEDVGKLLAYFNVKYIIVYFEKFLPEFWQKNYEGPPRLLLQGINGYGPAGAPDEYVKLLDKQKDLKLVLDKPEYKIYGNLDFTIPHISAYNRIFMVAPPDIIHNPTFKNAQNLVQNPGFEDELTSWVLSDFEDTSYSIDNTTSHSGQSCVRMELSENGKWTNLSQGIEVEENSKYRIEAWVKSKNAKMVQSRFYFRDSENKRIEWNGGTYIKLMYRIKPDEDWALIVGSIETPPGAVRMNVMAFDILHNFLIDEASPGTIWLDDVAFVKTAAMEMPVENYDYFYGYPFLEEGFPGQYLKGYTGIVEEFPLEYGHGQTLVTIPGLLSKIPNFNPSQHLLVLGEFLPSDEAKEEYLKLVDAVIFLGDVDGSEAAKKWTEEPETLLFVHEAESSLNFIPSEESEIPVAPVETAPIKIVDDNQAEFWQGRVAQVGSIGAPQLSNEVVEKTKGNDSLKISIGSGEGARWVLEHNYATPQDWSEKDFVSLYWYGGNTGATLRFSAATEITTKSADAFFTYFKDDFTGWKQIVLPLSSFSWWGKPSWDNITYLHIEVEEHNVSGTWYLDRVTVDVTPPPPMATVISSASAGTSLSYDHALAIDDEGELVQQFFAPRANHYGVMIRATVDGEISLKIDDELLNITDIHEGEGGFKWYESSLICLETGDHAPSIDFKGNKATFDQILILSTKREDITFKDIFSSEKLEIHWVEERPSEYSIQVNSDRPTFIVLGEAYHEEWKAYTDDGENLKHISAFPLGWANGFYLPQGGEQQVEIIFGMQKIKDIAIRVWMVAWICLVVGIVANWVLCYRRRSRR